MNRKTRFEGVSEENKNAIQKYESENKINGLSESTIYCYNSLLIPFARSLKKKFFKQVSKEDVKRYFNKTSLKPSSQDSLKILLKRFYRWLFELEKDERPPECVRWLKPRTKLQKQNERTPEIMKKKLISENEYYKILESTGDLQEKAIIQTLYLSGCRISELLSMNLCDVEDKNNCVEIYLRKSKTKPRYVPLVYYPEYLLRWIDLHPHNDPNMPLWINLWRDKRVYMKRMKVMALEQKIIKIANLAGLNRHITPHKFRHTAISRDVANGMPTTHVCTKYGWEKNSAMLKEYDHNDYAELLEWMTGREGNKKPPSYGALMREKEQLENKHNMEIENLKKQMQEMQDKMIRINKAMSSKFGQLLQKNNNEDITLVKTYNNYDEEDTKVDVIFPAPNRTPEQIMDKYEELKENAYKIIDERKKAGNIKDLNRYTKVIEKLL